jgi:hypothetical protein
VRVILGPETGNRPIEIDPLEINPADTAHYLFVARKAVGYLFSQPISATSILISLMRNSDDDETLGQLGALLFDPLLLSFTGKVRNYVMARVETESGKTNETLANALKRIDDYLSNLAKAGSLPALHPSQSQREAYHRHFSQAMSESFKVAQAESALMSLIAKKVMLYGTKSIYYAYQQDGKFHRMETPLKSHGIEMEFPRMQNIDPYGLDFMLRVFRAETLRP